jgi:hypothetical protein
MAADGRPTVDRLSRLPLRRQEERPFNPSFGEEERLSIFVVICAIPGPAWLAPSNICAPAHIFET